MEYYEKSSISKLTARQKTPCTNYSTFSSPAISPVHFSSSDLYPKDFSPQPVDSEMRYYNLVQTYFSLDRQKEKLNRFCMFLLQKQEMLKNNKFKFKSLFNYQQISTSFKPSQVGIDNKNFVQENQTIERIENQIENEKIELSMIIKDYFEQMSKVKEINYLLKKIVERTQVIDQTHLELEEILEKKAQIKTQLTDLRVENEFISRKKDVIAFSIQKIRDRKKEISGKVKNFEGKKTEIKNSENALGYMDATQHFSMNELYILKSALNVYEARIQSRKSKISLMKSSLAKKSVHISNFRDSFIKSELRISNLKTVLDNLSHSISSSTSLIPQKESYLDLVESNLYDQYSILDKCMIIHNLY